MKSFFVLASLAACAFAQRLHIAAPTTSQILKSGQWFTLELQQDQSQGALEQTSVLVAVNSCIEICDQPDKWSPSTVIYNDVFVPIYNKTAPQKGHYADLRLQLPPIQAGEAVIQVAHQFKEGGAVLSDVFDYTKVHVYVDQ